MKKATNLINGKRVVVTHGELGIVPVASIPKGKTTKYTKQFLASHSETGHHHLVKSKGDIKVTEVGEDRYMVIKEVATLFHQKTYDRHEDVILAPGKYQLTQKVEYDPFSKVVRRVWD